MFLIIINPIEKKSTLFIMIVEVNMSEKKENKREEEIFDLGFDEDSDSDENAERPNYTRTEVLPESRMIGGTGRQSSIHGSSAEFMGGRSSSPLLFSQASSFPECTQLRAWKMVNGIPTGLGVIDSNATEEDFVLQFRNAMPASGEQKAIFKIRPLDIDGQEMGTEISLVISEHHASLQGKKKADENALTKRGDGHIHNSMIEMLRETLHASQEALQAERLRTQELMSQMAQERIDLASNTASGIQMITERMLKYCKERGIVLLSKQNYKYNAIKHFTKE